MVIVRFEPGSRAPKSGEYTLVDHYGRSIGGPYRIAAGDPLPSRNSGGAEPHWCILLNTESVERLAA